MSNLVVTTKIDLELNQFRNQATVLLLEDFAESWGEIQNSNFDTIYLRSHFSEKSTMPNNFAKEFSIINETFTGKAYFVDNISSLNSIEDFEDKYNQANLFKPFLPQTWRADQAPDRDDLIYKKRLSSCASGISFNRDGITDLENWIAQHRINIQQELRVYVICGDIISTASIKNSKTESQKVKVVDTRSLCSTEFQFIKNIMDKMPEIDFAGIDIAVTPDGLKLIEINRSPAFSSFLSITGLDLADELYSRLRNKH